MRRLLLPLLILLCTACTPREEGLASYEIIPRPDSVSAGETPSFWLTPATPILAPEGLEREAEFLREYIRLSTGIKLREGGTGAPIRLDRSDKLEQEAYRIEVTDDSVAILGGSSSGIFYGIQALRKMLPTGDFRGVEIPSGSLTSSPRFGYRGMHLDVCRHFFDEEFVKRYIDLLALHGINHLHWHLSDDQGWRIEIEQYPRLTEVGDARRETVVGRNSDQYDGIPYGEGCYFTQEQARRIVAYAHERHMEVIPEIDLPGHMMAALAAYPELGCTGGPYEVWCRWGVSEEVLCAGNDQVLQFVCNILDEIMEIFPSEWIHIGGDECPKVRWEACPKCQARIQKEGLADRGVKPEEALQGWFMRQVIAHLNSRGRTAIGWDEVLEGAEKSDDLIIMSWRGEQGALEAARRGMRSIMAAQNYLYFDHYQTRDNSRERLALGGFNPIDRVYGFDPAALLPDSLKSLLQGVQANLWAEYILDEEHALHMALPRMAALSEIQWCRPEQKDYDDFLHRLQRQLRLYEQLDYNYAPYVLEIEFEVERQPKERALRVALSTIDGAEIRYTTDGSTPRKGSPHYDEPLTIDHTMRLQASALREGRISEAVPLDVEFAKSTLCPTRALTSPAPNYTFEGVMTLVDGLRGDKNYRTGRWLGFSAEDCKLLIDLEAEEELSEAKFSVCVNMDDGCFNARGLVVELSTDGTSFHEVCTKEYAALTPEDDHGIYTYHEQWPAQQARYIRLTIRHESSIPAWHPYYPGSPAFLFVDEVLVR